MRFPKGVSDKPWKVFGNTRIKEEIRHLLHQQSAGQYLTKGIERKQAVQGIQVFFHPMDKIFAVLREAKRLKNQSTANSRC